MGSDSKFNIKNPETANVKADCHSIQWPEFSYFHQSNYAQGNLIN